MVVDQVFRKVMQHEEDEEGEEGDGLNFQSVLEIVPVPLHQRLEGGER
jgi:hypothetical protein